MDWVGKFLLTLNGDRETTDLVAASVIEVLCAEENASLVTSRAILGPLHDVGELFVVFGLSSAEDEIRSTSLGLAGQLRRLSDVAVLSILHRKHATRGDLQAREVGRLGLISL